MPRMYASVSDVTLSPLGFALQPQLDQLPLGVLDKMLWRASARVDSFCKRRLQAPGITSVSIDAIAGDTTLAVASTLAFDELEEQAVIIGTGGTQETVLLTPGGVKVSSMAMPYPGTFTLATPLRYNHDLGEPVRGCYVETRRTGSSSTSDQYETVVTQQAQIAAAHAGGYDVMNADRTRYAWLDQYPLIQIYGMQHAYPWTSEYQAVDVPSLLIEPAMSRVKFPIGTWVLTGGLLQTTYTAGMAEIPEDVKDAVLYYLRDMLQVMVNPYGLISQSMGKRSQTFARGGSAQSSGKTPNVEAAEGILCGYKR